AVGSVLYYSQQYFGIEKFKNIGWQKLHFWLWIFALTAIITSYFLGYFSGREYFEYPVLFSIPVLLGWLIFAWYFLSNIYRSRSISKPVYIWMWSTGAIFFALTFIESNLWNFAWFRDNIIRDITVQWKANGAMVGSWNMLIYGSSIYLMQQISGSDKTAFSRSAFFFYFLGFTNLLFNWGHHTYVVPAASWVRIVSYAISMTEWVIFLSIIRNWRHTLSDSRKHMHILSYRFLLAAEAWVFINLLLALFMSIPAINVYTHGTHVTVAHAMGTTIGINSMILFASLFYIAGQHNIVLEIKKIQPAYWLSQISLFGFFMSLVLAGVVKAYLSIGLGNTNFQQVMQKVYPFLNVFAASGVLLLVGLGWLAVILLRALFAISKAKSTSSSYNYTSEALPVAEETSI
ncbi:MAG: cbb3-type cytochrome c oxidase subunit I, partial [Bacteroidia bacterium]